MRSSVFDFFSARRSNRFRLKFILSDFVEIVSKGLDLKGVACPSKPWRSWDEHPFCPVRVGHPPARRKPDEAKSEEGASLFQAAFDTNLSLKRL